MSAQQWKKCTSKDCSTRNHQVQGRNSPLNMYERKQPIGEKIQFAIPSAHDLDETQLDESCPNFAGDHDENKVDEYSDGSDSSDSEMDIDDEIENDLTFLRTTCSRRSITINRSLF